MVRAALLPANVLVSDGSLDWLRPAVPVILQHDLITARHVLAVRAWGDSAAYEQSANEVIEATVERYSGRLFVHTVVRDLGTQQIRPIATASGPESAGVVSLIDQVAKRIDAAAAAFPSTSHDVLLSYIQALNAPTAQAQLTQLQGTVNRDPKFGPAQLSLIAIAAEHRLPQTAQILQAAAPYRTAFDTIDRLSFDATANRLLHVPIAIQTQAAAALAAAAPNNLEALSLLGTADFLQNDAAAGERALKKALALTGGSLAIRLQLATGYIETRQYGKAADLLKSERDFVPVTTYAIAELLNGNKDQAARAMDAIYRARVTASYPFANLGHAEWIALSNGYQVAIDELERTTWAQPDDKAIALAQAAIWELALGNRPVAAETARRASAMAGAKAKPFAAAAAALCGAGSAANVQAQFGKANTLQSRVLLAYGLFFYGDYPAAAKEWAALWKQSGDSDESTRAMLAASLSHLKQQSPAVVQPFVPNLSGDDPFAAVAFNEMRKQIGP